MNLVAVCRTFIISALILPSIAFSSIKLGGTRIVFESNNAEKNISVIGGSNDVLIQSWVDSGEKVSTEIPFTVIPTLAKLPADRRQTLRILYEGAGLPQDRESVFWLNVQEIPNRGTSTNNVLSIAVKQRIKIFFRPEGLAGSAFDAPSKISWQIIQSPKGAIVQVTNPTPYFVSLKGMGFKVDKNEVQTISPPPMFAPFTNYEFPLQKWKPSSKTEIGFLAIDDFGAVKLYVANASATESATGKAKE